MMATPAKTPAATKTPVKKAAKPTVRIANKDTVTPIAKSVPAETSKAPAKPAKPAKPVQAEKQPKSKKAKLVRDSFTIPKDEYQVIDILKQRSAKLGQAMKKSELLRAGIKLLHSLADAQFKEAMAQVPAIKTGRPKKAK